MAAVSAVVPAAGLSRRMGGPNKLLLPYKDTTVVGAVVKTLLDCGIDVVVVTGRDAELVSEAAKPARTAYNAAYEDGLGTSIAAGVRAVPDSNAILIALADMPSLSKEVVASVIKAAKPDSIVVPKYELQADVSGHPVLFGPTFRCALSKLHGDSGARSVIDANRERVVYVQVRGSLHDIDDPSHV